MWSQLDRAASAPWQLRIPERWLRRNRKSLRDAGDELAEWVRRELADESIFKRLSTVPPWIHGQDSPHLWRWTTYVLPQNDGPALVRATLQLDGSEPVEQRLATIAEKILHAKAVKFRQSWYHDRFDELRQWPNDVVQQFRQLHFRRIDSDPSR